jgi:hypothetical protein
MRKLWVIVKNSSCLTHIGSGNIFQNFIYFFFGSNPPKSVNVKTGVLRTSVYFGIVNGITLF